MTHFPKCFFFLKTHPSHFFMPKSHVFGIRWKRSASRSFVNDISASLGYATPLVLDKQFNSERSRREGVRKRHIFLLVMRTAKNSVYASTLGSPFFEILLIF